MTEGEDQILPALRLIEKAVEETRFSCHVPDYKAAIYIGRLFAPSQALHKLMHKTKSLTNQSWTNQRPPYL